MRRRLILSLAALTLLAVLLVLAVGPVLHRRDSHGGPPGGTEVSRPLPRAAPAPLDPAVAEVLDQPTFAVLPAHQAVAAIARRFDGRLIGLSLVPPSPPEAARGVQLVYAARLLSDHRDVVEIRLDARDGRLLSARGNNLAAARRHGKDN